MAFSRTALFSDGLTYLIRKGVTFRYILRVVLEITRSLSGFPDHAAYKQIVNNPGQIKSQNYSKAQKKIITIIITTVVN